MNAITWLWDGIQELLGILITILVVLAVGSAIWLVIVRELPYKCYSEGRIVAEGVMKGYRADKPKWHGNGYNKLPDGRVIKGECAW